jgi:hypothetical protein
VEGIITSILADSRGLVEYDQELIIISGLSRR